MGKNYEKKLYNNNYNYIVKFEFEKQNDEI